MKNPIRPNLPPMPPRIRRLPVDDRGFPVPYFVQTVNGKPDHRLTDSRKVAACHRFGLCFICGERLGAHRAFPVGPMCGINRVSAEPPSHRECARWAVEGCPFLSRPHAHRRPITEVVTRVAPGKMLERNPGVTLIWITKKYEVIRVPGQPSCGLFSFADPVELLAYAEGRPATREEVDYSVAGGFEELTAEARKEDAEKGGTRGVQELERRRVQFTALLDQWVPLIPPRAVANGES